MGEEEDDDYESIYNDINFCGGFLQLLHKNDDLGFWNGDVEEKKSLLLPSEVPDAVGVSLIKCKYILLTIIYKLLLLILYKFW